MRTDDHQFIRVLTSLEFVYEPFVAFFVESAECTAGLVGIVENDDLERKISLRIEVIAGKSFCGHLPGESVANRLRRGVEEFAHPGADRKRMALRVGGNLREFAQLMLGPAFMMSPYWSRH